MIKFEIRNVFTGKVQFTAEIDCDGDESLSIKIGLAVKWAIKIGANLTGADLTGANLSDADLWNTDLTGANLSGADLTGADLSGANLTDANLRNTDLSGAYLSGAYLRNANLSGAYLDYDIQPGLLKEIANNVAADENLLGMGSWHSDCGTTHCLAGWASALNSRAKELEAKLGPQVAGLLTLGPEAHKHFFDNKVEALEFLKTKIS